MKAWLRHSIIGTVLAFGLGCGGESLEDRLGHMPQGRDGRVEYTWKRSTLKADVELYVISTDDGDTCQTGAILYVNTLASRAKTYSLSAAGCSTLQLTAAGDIILHGASTGYDWRDEALHINTDRE